MSVKQTDQSGKIISSEYAGCILDALGKHPYIFIFLICIILNPFYLGQITNAPQNSLIFSVFLLSALIVSLIVRAGVCGIFDKKESAVLSAVSVIIIFLLSALYTKSQYKGLWIIASGSFFLCVFCWLLKNKINKQKVYSLMIIGLSFIQKFHYVLYTTIYERQHDAGSFDGGSGHAGYIGYLLSNHMLPDFDVRDVWQFSHPPLHHTISALWIGLSEKIFGISPEAAQESIQTLTLFYAMAIIITSYRILRYFRVNGAALYIPLAVIAFHPSFTMFSGSINNDVLSVAFMTGAVYCTLRWYDDQSMKNIIKIAICTGLGMMTKLSAALCAPPIAIVFLVIFIKKFRTDAKKLTGQFISFAAVCVPLGLWFEIKNYIAYGIPITYVNKLDKNIMQYIGDQSYISRITDFSAASFNSVFEQWLSADENGIQYGYNEHNPLIALLKNSIFGEYINENALCNNVLIIYVCRILFWTAVILAAFALISMIIMCFRKCRMKSLLKVFFISFYTIMIANFYKMAADYPFTCTLNFRYITPTVITGALFTGLLIQTLTDTKARSLKAVVISLSVLTVLFAAASVLVFTVVVYPEPDH
ncbi:MAG: glycosyltransferase family 39 protein [Oscillospiraceae bacterium]|nr:glycosyltransferase family 39 protein [Oscillospiraceae bacterium]